MTEIDQLKSIRLLKVIKSLADLIPSEDDLKAKEDNLLESIHLQQKKPVERVSQ